MTFFDRCRVLFMLDRDTLFSTEDKWLSWRECRDMLSAFMQAYPEVQRYVEERAYQQTGRKLDVPALCHLRESGTMTGRLRSGHPSLDNVPREPMSGMEISHFRDVPLHPRFEPLSGRYPEFFGRSLKDDLVGEEVKPSVIEKLGAMEIRARDERHAEEANRILIPLGRLEPSLESGSNSLYHAARAWKTEGEIAAMYPTTQMSDPVDLDTPVLELIEWLKLHSSPSHQITAERMLKEWNVGDMTHAALVQWFLDNWSPSHATTIERLTRNYVVTRREP